jgi:hypothetical protein
VLNASQADVRRVEAAIEAQPSQDPAWWDVVAKFRAAAARMEQTYQRLLGVADYARSRPGLATRYGQLVQNAAALRATVADIRAKLEAAVNWMRSLGSAVGLSGLGILPVIGVAAVAAAIAMVTKWTTETLTFLKSVEEQKRLEAAGVPPERAAEIVRETASASRSALFDLGGFAKWVPIVGLGVAGWWAWNRWGRRG